MKTLLGLLILATGFIAWGQDAATCSTLYSHGDRNVVLCHAGDTFTKTDLSGSSASQVPVTAKVYRDLMAQDAADLQAHTAQLSAVQVQAEKDAAAQDAHHAEVMNALKLTTKKACTASGFAWIHGVCSVLEVK